MLEMVFHPFAAQPLCIKGDKVLFSSYAGTDVKVEGEEYLIMKEDDILAIIG